MKLVLILFLLYLSVPSESGIILDTLKTGFHKTTNTIGCGFKKVGGFISQTESDCQEKPIKTDGTIQTFTETHVDPIQTFTEPHVDPIQTLTETHAVSSSGAGKNGSLEGRRVIAVGANCPEGFRGDGRGNCREEY